MAVFERYKDTMKELYIEPMEKTIGFILVTGNLVWKSSKKKKIPQHLFQAARRAQKLLKPTKEYFLTFLEKWKVTSYRNKKNIFFSFPFLNKNTKIKKNWI